ncbi:MAG: glycosyltransferase family 39 protein [bacterium]|nr:glycosyltransferase family 39 protein [bacterium]
MMSQPKTRPFSFSRWIVLALALCSFCLSALVSRTVFERLPHLEDEMAYLYGARLMARGTWVTDTPEPRRSYWQPFVVDYQGNRFSKYTPGWSMQLAAGELMGQHWVINGFFAALVVALAYRLGRDIFNADTGVIAAALVTFSPAALLLNGSLMGHTSALFAAALFLYAYWRIESARRPLLWGVIGGIALGLLVINRPLTGIGIAAPLAIRSAIRLIRAASERGDTPLFTRVLGVVRPLVALGGITLVFALVVPLYNAAATGDPRFNLYTLVWPYDRAGFGPCCGRSGHTLEKGIRHLRFDMSLTAADLFGWTAGEVTPEVTAHLQNDSDYLPIVGLSFALLPLGLVVAFRWKVIAVIVWGAALVGWTVWPFTVSGGALTRDAYFAWVWLIAAVAWVNLPILLWRDRQKAWAWLLIAVTLTLIGTQIAYWVGSQRYSTRYFYEAMISAAILSALPLAWLARRFSRPLVYGALVAVTAWGVGNYTALRLMALYRYNLISPDVIAQVEARREGDRPVLVIVSGDDVRWRAMGALMAQTSPFLDSEIVVAHNYRTADPQLRADILGRFPDHQVIEMLGSGNQAWFADQPPPAPPP